VDVTNYVLLELGHPLHVFDRDRLHGALVVRRGSEGERLTCLDGVDRGVQDSLVIADDQGPVAVAGVMGGSVSSVQENTVRVVLESARFLPGEVRRTRNRLRLSTESSYRFERGTDVFVADLAGRRAVWLLSHWAGGQRTGQVDVGPSPEKAMAFRVSLDRLCELLGFELETQRVATLLERLQFTCVVEQNSLLITPPLHRADVRETADVVDEVARLMGYDKIPSRVRGAVPSDEDVSPRQRALGMARERLVSFGFWEAVQSGLVPRALWERWAGPTGENPPELANPLSLTGECLNPSLVVNLLSLLVSNNRQGHTDVRLFECARVFHRDGDSIKEDDHLAWVASGRDQGGHWKEPPRFLDFWDAKAWAQSLLEGWGLSTVTFLPADVPALHPKESLTFSVDGRVLGFFGRLHPKQAERWDVSHDTVVFECNLTALGVGVGKAKTFQGLSRVPVLRRDFSLVFQETVSWASITTWIHGNVDFVKAVELFDVFTGGGLPAGVRSLAFRVTFRHGERTLTDAEGQALQDRVVRGLGDQFQAKLRG